MVEICTHGDEQMSVNCKKGGDSLQLAHECSEKNTEKKTECEKNKIRSPTTAGARTPQDGIQSP